MSIIATRSRHVGCLIVTFVHPLHEHQQILDWIVIVLYCLNKRVLIIITSWYT